MDEQQLQQQIVQLVQAAMQGDQQASQQIQLIMLAAQQGDLQAVLIAQMIQAVAQQMQQGLVQAAKFGAKLNYIKRLRGQSPEPTYFKQGGQLQNYTEYLDPIEAFKCGNKIKIANTRVQLKKETKPKNKYSGNTTVRTWSDGTTSKRNVDEEGTTYIGRRGEVGITNVPNARLNAVADSLRRADWSGKSVPALKKSTKTSR